MRLTPLILAGAIAAMPVFPVAAQLRSSRPPPQLVNLPRLMVANPFSFSALDSAAAVRVGSGVRDRVEKVADRWYKAIARAQMNEALQQYAYPTDAVLPPLVARQLAQSLNARAMVISTLLKGEGGRYTVEARLAGMNDDAGAMVRVTQMANQAFEEFGARVGDSLGLAFRALPDAKACDNLRATNAEKAVESALKALRVVPNHGLAEYCLAQIAIAKKAPVDSVIAHLKAATKGDRLSLDAWTALAVQYQAKGDSTRTVETFKEMLRVAPTNEALRKEAYKLFLGYGKMDAAEEVAREGIAQDPANADLWDLLSSACLFQDTAIKNKCAVDALETVYTLDSTKADTTFFTKITFAASRPSRIDTVKVSLDTAGTHVTRDSVVSMPDTMRFLKWARAGIAKYPNNGVLIGQLAQAYSLSGPLDSAISVTKRLMAVDSSDVTPVLRSVKALVDAKRVPEAIALSPYIERFGDDDAKLNYANLVARGALPLLQTDLPTALEAARSAAKLVPKGNQIYALANYVLGIAAVLTVAKLDPETERTKSCDLAKQEQTLLEEAGAALDIGRTISPETADKYKTGVTGYTPRVAQMLKAYCK